MSHRAVDRARQSTAEWQGSRLAILAVKQVAHGCSARFVRLRESFAFVGVHGPLGFGAGRFGFAAGGAAIGEAGLIRLQLEFLGADGADFDRKCHPAKYDNNSDAILRLQTCRSDLLCALKPRPLSKHDREERTKAGYPGRKFRIPAHVFVQLGVTALAELVA
jgi:hypothetical protein